MAGILCSWYEVHACFPSGVSSCSWMNRNMPPTDSCTASCAHVSRLSLCESNSVED